MSLNVTLKSPNNQDVYPNTLVSNVYPISGGSSSIVNSSGKIKKQFLEISGDGGTTYTEGTGISISDDTISVDSSVVTTQGNTFNGVNQLVQLNSSGKIPTSLYDNTNTTYSAGDGIKLTGTTFSLSATIPTKTSQLTNDSNYATSGYVDGKISDLVNSAPAALDTLKELSDALSGDANFAKTVMNKIGQKQNSITSSSKLDYSLISGAPTALSQFTSDSTHRVVTDTLSAAWNAKVDGPNSSTVNHIATFSDATGKVIKDSGYTIETSVPANAVFTDTTYSNGTGISINTNKEISINQSIVAKLASPTFTGTPAAPTATAGTSTTQIATTEFVMTALSSTTIETLAAGGNIQPGRAYQITLTGDTTLNATGGVAGKVGDAQLYINPGTYTLTAGTNLTLVNELQASCTNHCAIKFYGTAARLFKIDTF